MLAPREIVLLHPSGSTPSGTARWLTPGRFVRHHHLRDGDQTHIQRLARRLAGRSIGLVLGGGGARGFAHIGVMRALREAGVPIDRVGGTSMGSIMSAQVALDWDTETMHARTREEFWNDPLAWDNTLPLVSKITCNKVVSLFQRLFGDTCGEDAWLPWFCIDVSLTNASTRVSRLGPLWQRVRASSALPGLGPPVIESGEFIIDGAVINNLPADVLVDEGIGPVIAVNVSPREDLGTSWPDNYRLSGWRLLWERLRGSPAARVYPSALWVLQRTVLLGSVSSAERMEALTSLYLRPPVDRFEMFKWRAIDEVVEVGYRETKDVVREWAARELSQDGVTRRRS
jgi:NTE family protein